MPRTPRRRPVKLPSGDSALPQGIARDENFRHVNQSVKAALLVFLAVVFTGYLLILRPPVQITVSVGAPAALLSVAATAVLGTRHVRGRRR